MLHVLLDVVSHADRFPGRHVLFLPENERWGPQTCAQVHPVDQLDANDKHPDAAAERLAYALSIEAVQDIRANLLGQVAEPSPDLWIAAFLHFYDHDAFLDVGVSRGLREG